MKFKIEEPIPNSPLNPGMTIEITEDFIGKFENAFTPEFCQQAISYFDRMEELGFGRSRQVIENVAAHLKDTVAYNTSRSVSHGVNDLSIVGVPAIQDFFLSVTWACYQIYQTRYSALQTQEEQGIFELKIQKTHVGGGFHVWHWEQEGRRNCSRFMNVQLFLNDVKEGGETEFLYLNKVERSEQGKLLIYPGNYTHTHRGNPPRSNSKYLINTWIEF